MFDIKAGNVMMDQDGVTAKITDVGLSKVLAGSNTATLLVRPSPLATGRSATRHSQDLTSISVHETSCNLPESSKFMQPQPLLAACMTGIWLSVLPWQVECSSEKLQQCK